MDGESKICKCGNTVGTPFVFPKSEYSTFGWFLMMLGISHPPVKVVFRCEDCGEILKTVTDRKLLREYTYR